MTTGRRTGRIKATAGKVAAMAEVDSGPPRTSTPVAPSISAGVIPAEWPAQAADVIVDTISKVRDRTTKPAILAARGLVYGLLAGVMALVTAILVLTMIVRMWDVYVPGHVWFIYAVFATLFSVGGALVLKKASAPSDPTG